MDNSFLIEEAYNQEKGVVQHINLFDFNMNDSWSYNLTQEWPLKGQSHQFSFTLPLTSFTDKLYEIDELLLNYRYQVVKTGNISITPRLTVITPWGYRIISRRIEMMNSGFQVNIPVSISFSKRFVSHFNFGIYRHNSRFDKSLMVQMMTATSGCSFIWMVNNNFNFLIEFIADKHRWETGGDRSRILYGKSWVINPGFRGAIDFENGLQIVPGLSIPVHILDKPILYSVLFYLSFEHPY